MKILVFVVFLLIWGAGCFVVDKFINYTSGSFAASTPFIMMYGWMAGNLASFISDLINLIKR